MVFINLLNFNQTKRRMKRHKWDKETEDLKNRFTEQHQCFKCGVYRIRVFGKWAYSKQKTSNDYPFVKTVNNEGCV